MGRGGKRPGAGRPRGQGRYGEPTVPVRVPTSLAGRVRDDLQSGVYSIPLYSDRISAGFPSPADDFVEQRLDANAIAIDNPVATFFLRVTGDSMKDAGIYEGDYLVVDRSRQAASGDIVVAAVDGDFTVKRLDRQAGRPILRAANPDHSDIVLRDAEQLEIFGVVCSVIRRLV